MTLASLALALGACGGNGTDNASVAGDYRHPAEGVVSLSADGTGTVDHGEVTISWTIEDDVVTLETEDGDSVEATLRESSLVFEPGVYSCCEDSEAVFVRDE